MQQTHSFILSAISRILVVEDNLSRIGWFRDNMGPFDVAETPEAALEFLKDGAPYEVVFLDHDAGGEGIGAKSTFFSVAERLAELGFNGTVVIHSYNPVGAVRMRSVLEKTASVTIAPFGTFRIIQ